MTTKRGSGPMRDDASGLFGPVGPADSAAAIAPGVVIDDRYRITGVLGSGGMGTVYTAEHLVIKRPVALKVLHPGVAENPTLSRRFEREAFAIGQVTHPNCVDVSDFGKTAAGTVYLVMELIDGVSLREVLSQETRLDYRRSLHIARHVLCGLDYAHRAGVVHRDIKPENIMICEQDGDRDFARILDFGLAKLIGAADQEMRNDNLSESGITFGTHKYMSPEQALGVTVDRRTDLYAVAVVHYEMLSGRVPFAEGDRLEILRAQVSHPVPPLAQVAPELAVPETVEALLHWGLAKKPEDRIPSAEAYIAAIDELLAAATPEVAWPQGPLHEEHVAGEDAAAGDNASADMLTVAAVSRPSVAPASVAPAPAAAGEGSQRTSALSQTGAPAPPPLSGHNRRRQVLIAAGVAVLFGVFAIALAVEDAPAPSPPNAAEHAPTRPLAPLRHGKVTASQAAREAEALLARGAPDEAIALLTADPAQVANDAHAQLQLGHAYAAQGQRLAAVAAYQRTLDLSSALADDAVMRASLTAMLDHTETDVVLAAFELLSRRLADSTARQRLLATASTHKRMPLRHGAFALAEELGLGGKIDRVNSYALDLRQGKRCEDRRAAVAKLRALGDKRAIEPLRAARERTGGGFLGLGQRHVNSCLRADAAEAITYLESL